jgi:hypothetical protein
VVESHAKSESLERFTIYRVKRLHQGDSEVDEHHDVVLFRPLGILQHNGKAEKGLRLLNIHENVS